MLVIDGSAGEGGGQVLRSSLALAMLTGQAFRIEHIRARRDNPGLRQQHLTAVRAAQAVCGATVAGDIVGSRELTFEPGPVRPGDYHFPVGTAGSTTLVLQTVLPALMIADAASHLTLEGGTHNPWAPPFDFIEKAFLPLLQRMGFRVTATLVRPGFYPAGGGRVEVAIEPPAALEPLALLERGDVLEPSARAIVARLPPHIARRELAVVAAKLGWPEEALQAETVEAAGPGNVLLLAVRCAHVTELFTGFGQRGVPAEKVAESAVAECRDWLDRNIPVGPHLADQLLLPLALAGGCVRTGPLSGHTRTNADLLGRFLDVGLTLRECGGDSWEIAVSAPHVGRQ